MSVRVEWLEVEGDPAAWADLGLTVSDDGTVPLIGTSLRIVVPSGAEPRGIVAWSLSGLPGDVDVAGRLDADGLVTHVVPAQPPLFADHEIGAQAIDHVVVLTADLERTSAAIAEVTGCELKRVREVGEMRQGFHRIGSGGLIAELVTRPDVPVGPAEFWGLVLIVDDIDAACERIGPDRIGAPKDAVQPGRRIATLRREAGLGLPVALMTPDR